MKDRIGEGNGGEGRGRERKTSLKMGDRKM